MLYAVDPFGAEESLLTHELYFGPPVCDRPKIVAPKEWFRNVVLMFYCDPDEPPRPAVEVSGQPPCIAVYMPETGRTVAVNFAETEQIVDSPAGRIIIPPQSVKVVSQDKAEAPET